MQCIVFMPDYLGRGNLTYTVSGLFLYIYIYIHTFVCVDN